MVPYKKETSRKRTVAVVMAIVLFSGLLAVASYWLRGLHATKSIHPDLTPKASPHEPFGQVRLPSIKPIILPSPSLLAQKKEPVINSSPKPQSTPAAVNFTASVDLTEDIRGLGYVDARKIVRSASGTLFAVYRKKDLTLPSKEHMIFIASSNDGGKQWKVANGGKAISQGVGPYDQRVPAIALDDQENIHVVWYGIDSVRNGKNQREIKYAQSTDLGKSFSLWRNIAPIEGYSDQDFWQEHPSITAGSGDNLYVVWEGKDRENPDNQQVKFISSADGGKNWTAPKLVYRTNKYTQSRPTLVRRKSGELVIACYTSYNNGGGIQQIQISTSGNNGESWSDWRNISKTSQDARHVSMIEDQDQTLYFAWRQMTSNNSARIYTTSLRGDTVTPAAMISDGGKSQFFPSLGVANSALVVTFTETDQYSDLPREEVGLPAISKVFKYTSSGWQEVASFPGGSATLPRNLTNSIEGLYLAPESSYTITYFNHQL